MTPIKLSNIWNLHNPHDFKAHFATWNGDVHPLEVFARNKREWQEWQEFFPGRDDFNRRYIFSLAQFYHEYDSWLFGGVFEVLDRNSDGYEVRLTEIGEAFIGRMKIRSTYKSRTRRINLENHIDEFEIIEILPEPYSGSEFPGFEKVELSFDELETIVRNGRLDWRTALENVKGIYLITDTKTGKRYVGSAYGGSGIWSRWHSYVDSGHGGNVELRNLVNDPSLDYCRANFRFALLETHASIENDQKVIDREAHWKNVLISRGADGLNRN